MRGGWVWVLGVLVGCGSPSAVSDGPAAIDASPDAIDAAPDAPASAPALTLTSSFDDFGTVGVGTTSGAITVVARNTGGSMTNVLAATIEAMPMQFAIDTDTCSGVALPSGASCSVNVRFMPTQPGSAMAMVRVGDGIISATRALQATAINSDNIDTVSPSLKDFGEVAIGTTTAAQTFTVTNIGGTTHGPLAVTLAGADPAAFALVADNCSGTMLPPIASCTFGVTFTPHASGEATEYVQVTTPSGHSIAGLRGSGLDPVLRVDLSSRDFGSVPQAALSEYARFEVTNVSATATAPLMTTIGGMHPNDFTIAAATNTCANLALAPGATCAVEVRFEPTAVQHRYARLTVGDATSSAVVALTGDAGTANSLQISPTPFSFGDVVIGGTSAAQTFTVTNAGSAITIFPVSSSSPVFQVTNDTCSNVLLAHNASCTFDVTAHPTASGFAAQDVGTFVYSGLLVRGVP
jgi:hypothetical protein